MTREEEQAWLRQWEHARGALNRVRTRELEQLSAEKALAATDALLSLARPDPARRATSGLVEQQRLFRRLPR